MTAAMLGVGLLLIIWPNAFVASKFQFMLDVLSPSSFTAFYLLIGAYRATALYLNGKLPIWGPRVRALTALGGAFAWLQMGISLIIAQIAIGAPPSPSVPVFMALAASELYSTYWAAADARYR